MKLLRLFVAIFSVSLRRELAFRANLLFQVFVAVTTFASGLITLRVVYTQTELLGGWALGEAIMLLGVYGIMSGLLATFVEPNVQWFAGQVRSGKLDDILLKPVSGVFLVSLGSCAPLALSQALLGILVLAV